MRTHTLVFSAAFAALSLSAQGQLSLFDFGKKSKPVPAPAPAPAPSAVKDPQAPAKNPQFLTEPADKNMAREYTVQQLNQIIWVIAGVLSYNDVRFLEEADKVLSESYIDVTRMNDPELLRIIRGIRQVIQNMRIEEGDREIMEQEIAARRADALWNAVSGLSVSGKTPTECFTSLLTSSVQSYTAYRRETKSIERDFTKQQWELDKARLKELSEFNTELLEAAARLAAKNGMKDDSPRLSVEDAKTLREQLKGGYEKDVLTYLSNPRTEQTYGYLPEYWYHRGARMLAAAEHTTDPVRQKALKEDARKCFKKYQEMFVSFRRSRDAVAVAAGMLKLLGEDYAKGDKSAKAEMMKQASIIEHFSDQSDLTVGWQDNYVLYLTYKGLGEKEKAMEALELALSSLKNASTLMTAETLSTTIGKGKVRPVRSYARPIALCMQAMSNECSELGQGPTPKFDEELNKFLNDQYSAAQTQMFLAGGISEEKQSEIVLDAIGTPPADPNNEKIDCAIWEYHESENAVICQVPMRFFLTDEVDCEICFWSDEQKKWITVYEWVKNRQYLMAKDKSGRPTGEVYAVQLEFKIWDKYGVDIEDINKVRLNIMHQRMPVGLTFSKEYRDPVEVRFGQTEGTKDRHNVTYRCVKPLNPRIKYDTMEDRFEKVKVD